MKSFKDSARTRARLHEAVDDEEATRRFVWVLQLAQPRMRQMDIGEAIVALTPSLRGAFDIAQHRGRNGLAISRRQQRQHPCFLALQALQPARTIGRNQHRARSQHQTLRC